MSTSNYIYVGPYIKFKNKEFKFDATINSCSNTSCKNLKNDNSGNFCSHCGSQLIKITVLKVYTLGIEELLFSNLPQEYRTPGDFEFIEIGGYRYLIYSNVSVTGYENEIIPTNLDLSCIKNLFDQLNNQRNLQPVFIEFGVLTWVY